jgi:hypothetical protein
MGWTETRAALQFSRRVVTEVDPVVEGQEKSVGVSAKISSVPDSDLRA